jgi:hypothetical protein
MTTESAPPSSPSSKRPVRPDNAGGELKSGLNINSENIFDKLRETQIIEYSPDTYKGKTRFEAYVISNPYAGGEKPLAGDYGVRVRCRIDELYKHLPPPDPGTPLSCEVATLYPEFVAESLEAVGLTAQPQVGTGLTVEFVDRFQTTLQYANGRIIGPNGKIGAFVSKAKKSPIEEFVKNNCKELERKYNRIQILDAAKMCTNGEVFDWRKPDCFDPQKVIDEIPPPPPENDTAWAPDPECDKSYVLEQVRARFDQAAGQTPADVLKEIKKKIWWDDKTAEQISRLHPGFRDKVVAMMVQLVENPKSLLANAPGPLYTRIYKDGGTRTLAQQTQLWSRGRLAPGTRLPNGVVVPDNVCDPSSSDCKIVSNATEGESLHNFGLAVDLWPMQKATNSKPGKPENKRVNKGDRGQTRSKPKSAYRIPSNSFQTPASDPCWDLIGAAGNAQGFYWGRNFSGLGDTPHFQLRQHFDLEKLRLQVINGQTKNGFVIL